MRVLGKSALQARIAIACAALLIAWSGLQADARRSRPGGGSAGAQPQQASGRATYGYRGHRHGHHRGHGGYHFGYYAHYGWHAWPWSWWYPTRPIYLFPERIDPQAAAAVETDVKPKRAEVYVDGQFLGQARDYNGSWDLLWLQPGRHLFEFRRDGYRTLERELELRPGFHVRIEERLEKGEGIDPRSTRLPARPAARAAEEPARVEGPQGGTLAHGLLRMTIEPADAAVYLDNEFLARGSELKRLHGALPVARGRHLIEVVRPGYETQRVEVDVEGEEPLKVEIRLDRSR